MYPRVSIKTQYKICYAGALNCIAQTSLVFWMLINGYGFAYITGLVIFSNLCMLVFYYGCFLNKWPSILTPALDYMLLSVFAYVLPLFIVGMYMLEFNSDASFATETGAHKIISCIKESRFFIMPAGLHAGKDDIAIYTYVLFKYLSYLSLSIGILFLYPMAIAWRYIFSRIREADLSFGTILFLFILLFVDNCVTMPATSDRFILTFITTAFGPIFLSVIIGYLKYKTGKDTKYAV